ncbi:sulfite exporter TauE/SafE family protein [Helcobacillus massiliensis]|uniref:Probable membrane transporter protein n=1 Tax=Helcobacillus massiliensis TaxID=521392 RepID=A0A839R253_9MICO|nr:sulfite exporter TauE/SafE family protein [Helcobacillus massiliensis]MBB3022796.1 hypothetical protein [Helcobacillus massiliensis]
MDPLSLVLLAVAAVVAGAINAAVGSGSLLTLPVLLAMEVPPGAAVRTNTIGMVFSTIGAVAGYRREIREDLPHLKPLMVTTTIAALAGAGLLLVTGSDVLDWVVPVLIVVALVLVVCQPLIARRVRARSASGGGGEADRDELAARRLRSPGLIAAMSGASLYGGFFTAAQGVLYLAFLGSFTGRQMRSVNGIKNLLSLIVNVCAALVYLVAFVVFDAPVVWLGVLVVGVGSLIGSSFGAHLAKRIPEWLMRGVIIVVALVALARQVM